VCKLNELLLQSAMVAFGEHAPPNRHSSSERARVAMASTRWTCRDNEFKCKD